MSKSKLKATKKIATVIKKYDSELEVLKAAKSSLDEYFEAAHIRYSTTLNEVDSLENELRQNAIQNANISITGISIRRDYLLQQRELVEQQRLEKERIELQRDGVIKKLNEQKIKIQLLEKVKERRVSAILDEMERNESKDLDDLWLSRR